MSAASNQSQPDPVAEFHRVRTELILNHAGNVASATDELLTKCVEVHERYLSAVNTGALSVYRARTHN